MNFIRLFIVTISLASTIATGTLDNDNDGGNTVAPTTINVNNVPPPAPAETATTGIEE